MASLAKLKSKVNFDRVSSAVAPSMEDRFAKANDVASRAGFAISNPNVSQDGTSVVKLDPNQLDDNPFNARHVYTESLIAERVASFKENGQQVPVSVFVNSRGGYTLIDGGFRKRAAIELGVSLDALIKPRPSDKELWKASAAANEHNPQSAIDDAFAFKRFLDEKIFDNQRAIAAFAKKDETYISRCIAITELPNSVIQLMCENPSRFSLNMAYEVLQLSKSNSVEELIGTVRTISEQNLSIREVRGVRSDVEHSLSSKAALNGLGSPNAPGSSASVDLSKKKRLRATPRTYKSRNKHIKGSVQSFPDSGRVVMAVDCGTNEKARTELLAVLKKFLLWTD
jgi:ParB/RepB/Spo0J family partition protein